jgi:transcriptional regulator with XRE-family HTH domain
MSINFRGLQERLRERLLTQIEAGELTGIQLARETGFQQAHISNFLNRKRGLSLEAMDTILKVTRTSLPELIEPVDRGRKRQRAAADDCAKFVSFPIVNIEDCAAVQVPNVTNRGAIMVANSLVQRLRTDMYTPRPHWQRFVAVRLPASECEVMSRKIARSAIVGVDRHYNSLAPFRSGERNMYVVRWRDRFVVRYVEQIGEELMLRAESAAEPLMSLPREKGEPMAAIIGRVCWVWGAM